MTSKWARFYQSEFDNFASTREYYVNKITYKLPLLKRVSSLVCTGDIVELGCGTGLSCIYLSTLTKLKDVNVIGIDSNEEMIEIAQRFCHLLDGSAIFEKGDIFDWEPKSRIDVAFNNGVMEHFSDEEIVRIINHTLAYSDQFLFGVPSMLFTPEQAINGDERFLSTQKWIEVISKSNGSLKRVIGYDYRNNLVNKILQKFSYNRYQFIAFALGSVKK